MPRFYWSKAAPGMYYLWDGPKGSRREHVATCTSRGPSRSYLITILLPDAMHPMGWGKIPMTALREAESQVAELVPGATFTREGF